MSSLDEFLVFKDVALTGNITRTSQRLHMSQPSVSIQIQNLERDFGVQLLNRTNRGVTLTENGKVLFRYVEEIIQLIMEAREVIANSITTDHGGIHIGATFTIGEYLLSYLVREYCKTEHDYDVDAKISDTEALAQEVLARKLNVALIEGPLPNDPNYSVEVFWHDELVVVVPIDHPWSDRKTITFEELLTERIITREQGSGTRKVMERVFEHNNFNYEDLDVKLELGSTQAIKQAVKCGMGITIVSALTVQEECELGQLVALRVKDCSFTRPLSILTHTKGHLTANEQSFITLLRNRKKLQEIFPTPAIYASKPKQTGFNEAF